MRPPSVRSLATASPRRLLLALAGLLVASGVALGSGANFNSTSANRGSLITTGTVVVTDSLPGQSILTLSAIRPGTTNAGRWRVRGIERDTTRHLWVRMRGSSADPQIYSRPPRGKPARNR